LIKIERIVDFLGKSLYDDFIIEIGPGLGGLTSELLEKRPYKVIGVERDQELQPVLQVSLSAF
jgi:16S rRNA A1518/A1519 N6-dimethyltransferase RsmA/KsgA/DIM1 with predicted DNA glycosylase/AP lyase activity